MKTKRHRLILAAVMAPLLCAPLAFAKMDLATLPVRDKVQITIYNSADLTLVREQRALTLSKGINRLQFSWANTLIDPTSLEMLPKANGDKIEVLDLVFPPRVANLGLWNIKSDIAGRSPFEITYFTSGISWRAFYMGTLSSDEKVMRLQAYVRVTNRSGEDYENAETRLIVGKVHILDQIANLARRRPPYGRPEYDGVPDISRLPMIGRLYWKGEKNETKLVSSDLFDNQKRIKKEGLSEYFLYTIEGTETIRNGWSKRLPSFDTADIPVVNLYKYERKRWGAAPVRFLSFKNDVDHKLGDTPIPGGKIKVYRGVDDAGHLSYEGQSSFKYIPVEEDVELNLGAVQNVIVKPIQMSYATARYAFDRNGNISGWDEIREFAVSVKNTRGVPVTVEITRNFLTQYWSLVQEGEFGEFKKIDLDTVRFTLKLEARSQKAFTYILTTRHGTRTER